MKLIKKIAIDVNKAIVLKGIDYIINSFHEKLISY